MTKQGSVKNNTKCVKNMFFVKYRYIFGRHGKCLDYSVKIQFVAISDTNSQQGYIFVRLTIFREFRGNRDGTDFPNTRHSQNPTRPPHLVCVFIKYLD